MTHDSERAITRSSMAEALSEANQVLWSLASLESPLTLAAEMCLETLRRGGKILACGNGGSAAEAQHLVGELAGRYQRSRRPLAAVALNADSTLLTCIGNDFSFEDAFARQVEGLGRPGDLLIAFTSSGNSPNIVRALRKATQQGLRSVAFLGRDGGQALALADCSLLVAHANTARIQEGHNFLMHCLMDAIEAEIAAVEG